ncbi:MAG: MFS transporter [Chloroflexi bacterium]|nr:MFS transporter [Chloroflexota bacterium]
MSGLLRTVARAPHQVFYGWWIVLAGATMNFYGSGVWFYGFPVFFKPIVEEFGWSRAATAGAFSLSRVEGGLEAPIVGWLVDKFGPRRLAIMGAMVAGLGFLAMSQITSFTLGPIYVSALFVFYGVYAGILSVGYNTGFGHAAQAAIANWFIKKRSRAFALYSLGAGASGLIVGALGWLISNYGWRTSALLAGIGMFLFVVPLAFVLRRRPEEYGYLPDGEAAGERAAEVLSGAAHASASGKAAAEHVHVEPDLENVAAGAYDFTVKQALLTMAFWMLLLGSAARSITMTSVIVHEVAYLTDIGISFAEATAALGGMVILSLIGRVCFGWLGDTFDKRYVILGGYFLQALGILILDNVTNMTQVWVFAVVYALGYGGVIPVWVAMRAEYFGRRNFATIGGFMQFFLMPATVIGPVYAGWVFDYTQSYHWAFMSFLALLTIGAVFIFFAKRPSPPALVPATV